MNRTLFSENMKLAELLLTNYRLLYVFPCFGIGLGFGECTVGQICEKNGISTSLFLLVCNVYTFDDYTPDTNVIAQIPLSNLIEYLQNSHSDYLSDRMPKILEQILELLDCCHVKHGKILTEFCEKYKQEVITHFDYEEQIVFPYITALLKGERPKDYKIEVYEGNHTNIEAALSDLKNIILKYLPNECTIERCRDMLIDLFLFDTDLCKHTLLEDQILVALVERIENGLDE